MLRSLLLPLAVWDTALGVHALYLHNYWPGMACLAVAAFLVWVRVND